MSVAPTILLILLTLLLTSCMSTTREREIHCLAATMTDVWQMEREQSSAEQVWRAALQARGDRSAAGRDASAVSVLASDRNASSIVNLPSVRREASRRFAWMSEEEETLYERVVASRARHGEASKWYGLVAQRVQTRIEEDDMLYPVLGMLATSTAIVLYPLVRWNVRSVLWDGIDPDAEDDPVQRFCIARLGEATHHQQP
jgi:hypothetical protein